MKREKLVLIDGHSILNRAFYGMPDLTNSEGLHTGAVYGFLNIMFKILEEEKADALAAAFDVHAPTFRHETYGAYKGTRKPMPEELREQVPLIKQVLASMGVPIYEQAGLEADDILGTLADKAEKDGMDVTLVSGDRDLLQVASDRICVRIPKTRMGQTVVEDYHAADVLSKYQVTPAQFIDVKALMGDSSDNVPGVPKVGEKTAISLIVQYGSLDGVYEHLDEIKKPALHRNLQENEDLARLSKYLVTIKKDCDIPLEREKLKLGDLYTKEAFALFTRLNFRAFLPRFAVEAAEQEEEKENGDHSVLIDTAQALDKASGEIEEYIRRAGSDGKPEVLGVYPVYDPVRYGCGKEVPLYGMAVSTAPGSCIWAGVNEEISTDDLLALLEKIRLLTKERNAADTRVSVWTALYNMKEQFAFWGIPASGFSAGIDLKGVLDLHLLAYLLNPLQSDYQPEMVASEHAGLTRATRRQIFGKSSMEEAVRTQPEEMMRYACGIASMLRGAALPLWDKVRKAGMGPLYDEIELPLTYILYDMERIGVRLLPKALKEYSDELGVRIDELTASIYEQTGETFNIASPKQLGTILVEKMGIKGGKKTKTGYSTAADVLEKLAPYYPVVNDILEYRALTKLKSTYADGLTAYVEEDGRIHTRFNQTVTATGRISSNDPNLQNIPMRTEMGKRIRKAFVPKEGMIFTDADYSQIELRILAHMSGDPELIAAFRENKDIHRITASKVFHTPFDEVTDLQRRGAKAVNFGIVYGQTSFGLSQNLGISRQEAADYIEAYFRTYPAIKAFLDGLVDSASEKGYAQTLYGRRRPVPELKAKQYMQRQFGERVAMNSPIQGTAADIMKIAMIRVWETLHRRNMRSELILQIHDELLIETAPGEEEAVREILRDEMEHAASLSVQLETDVSSGDDWYMAK